MLKRLFVAALVLGVPVHVVLAQALTNIPVVSHVEMAVRVDLAKRTLSGVESMRIENGGDEAVRQIPLNLNRLMRYTSAADSLGPLQITEEVATFGDRPMLQVNHALVTLRQPLSPHAREVISIGFEGHLVGYTETGSLYIRDTVDETFTILRRDAYAYPVVETLSSAANRATYGRRFTFDVRVTLPSTHTAATGGELVGTTSDGGLTTYHFRCDAPAPFLNIAVARYKTLDRGGARIYHFPEDTAGAARLAEKTGAAIELLTKWFGPLQHAPHFTIIEIPDDMGSQADLNAGVIQTATAFRNADSTQELYHELSHFWAVPDTDAPSPRWNEGLAMFLQRVMAAEMDGKDELAARAQKTAARLAAMSRDEPRLATVPFRDYGREQMTDYAYGTGFLMFYALEKRIGRDALLESLRQYFQQYKAGGAGFTEFTKTAAAVSRTDLVPFFGEWFATTRWIERLKNGDPVERIGGPPA